MSYFDSEQTQAVRDSVTGEASEVLGLTVDGIELELKGQLTDQLTIAAGYSKFDSETGSGGEPAKLTANGQEFSGNFALEVVTSNGADRAFAGRGAPRRGGSGCRAGTYVASRRGMKASWGERGGGGSTGAGLVEANGGDMGIFELGVGGGQSRAGH